MLHRMTGIVDGLVVYPERMRRNIESTRGVVYSGRLLNALTAAGMSREDAYRIVQAHAIAAAQGGDDFRQRVSADPEVRARMNEQELADVFGWRPTWRTWTPSSRVFAAATA
jgi:adenylosuccinate lyase